MIAWFRAFISRLLGFLTGRDPDRDFDEELETHLRMLTERFVRQGMTEEDAHYAARRRFGNRALVKEVRNGM